MTAARFKLLLEKHVANLASKAERRELLKAVKSGRFDDILKDHIESLMEDNPTADMPSDRADEIFNYIIDSSPILRKKSKTPPALYYKIAASVLLILSLGLATYFLRFNQPTEQAIIPGANKAILELADGTEMILDSLTRGSLFNQGGVQAINTGGNIAYSYAGDSIREVMFHTITTPRGGQYEVTLADGTHVWLNAASSIRYPVTFDATARKVKITGEAYFEVAQVSNDSGKVPFTVSVNDMEVHVLGTHFNIMAYDNEAAIQTTLLEGSVKVKGAGKELLLAPGQQSNWQDQQLYLSAKVDTRAVTAWKEGYFRYANTGMSQIMNQLGRWYDVNITYENEALRQLSFGGVISRRDSVQKMLRLMELTGAVHFDIDGRTITVRQGERKNDE